MIMITSSKDEFLNDIHDLVKAFYPDEQLNISTVSGTVGRNAENSSAGGHNAVEPEDELLFKIIADLDDSIGITIVKGGNILYSESVHAGRTDRRRYKNCLKRVLYRGLSELTGNRLPWGTLTGVRPVKIAFERLEHEESKADIAAYMREEYLCSGEKTELSLQVAGRELELLRKMDYRNGYSVYIGIPFCPSTCLYCSFTSYSLDRFGSMTEQYLQALFKEIDYAGTCCKGKKLITVYLGGGTPTTLSEGQLDRLLDHIGKSFDFKHVMEYTVEAGRPDSITRDKLNILMEHGVSRISINPQSMRQKTLNIIGRRHTVEQVTEAFHMARSCGHDNINMDIIIGLPGEDKEDVEYTLREIDKLKPDSLTVHTLALKRAARLNIEKEEYRSLVSKGASDMLELTAEYARQAHYLPYYLYRQKNMADNLENIGYAHYGKEGLYNILIMEEKQTILALGAGALSKFIFYDENRIERVENVKSLKDYIGRIDEMIERKQVFFDKHII